MRDTLELTLLPGQPERLTNERYLSPRAQLRIIHQFVPEPVALHWHEFYEMHLILSGEGTHVLNGGVLPLARGSLFLLTPADFHALCSRPAAPLELFNVIFSDGVLSEEVRRLLFDVPRRYLVTLEGAALAGAEAEFGRLWREAHEERIGSWLVMRGALERILIDLLRQAGAGEVERAASLADRRRIGQALTYLHHHFREPLTLAQVARQAHLSPHYFSRCFHAATGIQFQCYLRDLRLQFARSLLAVSDASITDLCLAAGFTSLSNFERAFKARCGVSPRMYRAAPGSEDV